MTMTLKELIKRYSKDVSKMDVAAPVDLEYMFRDGLIEVDEIEGKRKKLADKAGVFVAGSVNVENLTLDGHALFVAGDVTAQKVLLRGTVVVMGDLTADQVTGEGEPFTLTVMGRSTVKRVDMKHQFIVQLLGTGKIQQMTDDEGGAEEPVELWRDAGSKVKVVKCG